MHWHLQLQSQYNQHGYDRQGFDKQGYDKYGELFLTKGSLSADAPAGIRALQLANHQ